MNDRTVPRAGAGLAPDDPWPLTPAEPRQVSGVVKLFMSGVAGGFLALFGLSVPASQTVIMGATRGLQIDRDRQQRCLELGVTLEELDALDAVAATEEPR